MLRRYDSLSRMLLTVLVAVLVGVLLEADGLHLWAERLGLGVWRERVLPVTETWQDWLAPLGFSWPRTAALAAKADLAPLMLGHLNAPAARDVDLHSMQDLGALPVSVEVVLQTPYLRIPLLAGLPSNPGLSADLLVTTAPLLPAPANALPLDVGDGLQIALAGDSMMAVGLAPTLTRGLGVDKGVRLLKAYRSGTGLARPEVYDWLQQYPLMLGETRPQLVICALGANDGQNVQVGKKVLEFGSPEWDAFYRERLTAYLDMLLKPQTRVLWVGMPVMKERRFAQKMLHMNALVRTELQRYPAVTWLDPNPVLGYADNVFAQYRADERGKLVKMRADDGIHMTDDGAAYLLAPIRDWLARTAPLARPAAAGGQTTGSVSEDSGRTL